MEKVNEVTAGNILIGGDSSIVLIAGPCVIENESDTLFIAERLAGITQKLGMPFIFKSSYDKANRTSINSYRGPGLNEGLRILAKVKKEFKVPILTDVHCAEDMDKVSETADVVQIPALLCRQTDLLVSAGRKARCVNVKKGQFLAPEDMKNVVEKVERQGNRNIIVTERGTVFGYNRLVSDMCSLPVLRGLGYPVIFDVTHSLQVPGGMKTRSGGMPEFIRPLARAAAGCGCDGIFMEVHPDPENALSDGSSSLRLDRVRDVLDDVLQIDRIVRPKGERCRKS